MVEFDSIVPSKSNVRQMHPIPPARDGNDDLLLGWQLSDAVQVPHPVLELLSGQFASCIPLSQDVNDRRLRELEVLPLCHAVEKANDQEDHYDSEHGVGLWPRPEWWAYRARTSGQEQYDG
jgi:hypothetical protein